MGGQLVCFRDGAGKQHLPGTQAFQHALDIEGDKKFRLDNKDGLVIEHVVRSVRETP